MAKIDVTQIIDIDAIKKALNEAADGVDRLEKETVQSSSAMEKATKSVTISIEKMGVASKKLSADMDGSKIASYNAEIRSLVLQKKELVKESMILQNSLRDLGLKKVQLTAVTKQLETSIKATERAQIKYATSTTKVGEAEVVAKAALAQRNKEMKEAARQSLGLVGAYDSQVKSLMALEKEYKDLSVANKLTVEDAKRIESAMRAQAAAVNKADQAVTRMGVNSRVAKTGFNGLHNSVNQLTREAPAFALSMSTGFLAISNNIPILADEIKNLNARMGASATKAERMKATFKAIGGAIFSWQTLLSVGVTLLTLYGAKLYDLAQKAMGTKKAVDALKEAQTLLNDNVGDSLGNFMALVDIVKESAKGTERHTKAVKALNKLYPDFNANVLESSKNNKAAADEVERYTEALVKQAISKGALTKIEEQAGDLADQRVKQAKAAKQLAGAEELLAEAEAKKLAASESNNIAEYNLWNDSAQNLKATVKQKKSTLDGYSKDVALIESNIKEFAALVDVNDIFDPTGGKDPDWVNPWAKLLTEDMQSELTKEMKARDWTQSMQEIVKDMRELVDFGINKGDVADIMGSAMLEGAEEATATVGSDVVEELFSPFEVLWYNFRIAFDDNAREIMTAVADISDIIGNQIFANTQVRLDNELAAVQDFYDKRLAVDNLAASDKVVLEEELARKQAEIRRKQAAVDKRQALYNVALSTAEGIAKSFTLKPPASFINAGIVGAMGIAQAAAINSAPLPAFEDGGTVGQNSPIITSEAGYEYAVKPDGSLLKTGSDGAEVRTDIPKGSFVIPHHISKSLDAQGFGLNSEINDNSALALASVMEKSRRADTQLLAEAMAANGGMISEAVHSAVSKIPQTQFEMTDKKLKRYVKRGNKRSESWSKSNKY